MYSLDDRPFFDINSEDVKKPVNAVQPLQGIGGNAEPTPPPLGPSATEAQMNSMLTGKMLEGGAEGIYQGAKAGIDAGAEAAFQAADAAQLAGQGLSTAQTASTLAATGAEGAAAAGALGTAGAGTAGAALGAGAGAAGTAALGALGPLGIGLIGAKMLGLFNNGTTSVPGYMDGTQSVQGGKGVSPAPQQQAYTPMNPMQQTQMQQFQPNTQIQQTAQPVQQNPVAGMANYMSQFANQGTSSASPIASGTTPTGGK